MSKARPPRRFGRSIGALFAGFVMVVVLTLGTDSILRVLKILPPLGLAMTDAQSLIATAYRTVFSIAGTYITARLAPYGPMQHALVGGAVGLVLSTVGAIATWNHVPTLGPHWYSLALIATAIPCAWAGGAIRVMQLSKRSDIR